jgi:uncharacterized protein with ParB-like and HNH nuclease domain
MQPNKFLQLLNSKIEYHIPVYQRSYSWTDKQCQRLLNDIIRIGSNDTLDSHFMGSVVSINKPIPASTMTRQYLVIDGQQRITTVSLLLLAVSSFLKKEDVSIGYDNTTWKSILRTYLINNDDIEDQVFKPKLNLRHCDKEEYQLILKSLTPSKLEKTTKRINENFKFFWRKINIDNINHIYSGLCKLSVVDINLEDKDNPQRIFESINSTGLDLTAADLIRNHILMGFKIEVADQLYEYFWKKIEVTFEKRLNAISSFIRDYLIMKNVNTGFYSSKNSSPQPIKDDKIIIYEAYESFLNNTNISKEFALEDLYNHHIMYSNISCITSDDNNEIQKRFRVITNTLKLGTAYPLLLRMYEDYKNSIVNENEFIICLDTIISYIIRRSICSESNGSKNYNIVFVNACKHITNTNYSESLTNYFLGLKSESKFKDDIEFKNGLMSKELYNYKFTKFILETIENFNKKEIISCSNYTMEHILPQSENLPYEWKIMLGDDWQDVKDKYLHNLGNLTLSCYNSELSNKPFGLKKTIVGGYDSSPLFLNETLRKTDIWNKEKIIERSEILSNVCLKIWKYPSINNNIKVERVWGNPN